MSDLFFTSDKNYLKRHTSTGQATINAPSTATPWIGGTDFYAEHTVVHGLGFVPQVRVYFEASASDGKVYPAGGRRLTGDYPGQSANGIICLYEITSTTLTISLESNTTKTGTRVVYYVIYVDVPV